jgi:hypothetical protein
MLVVRVAATGLAGIVVVPMTPETGAIWTVPQWPLPPPLLLPPPYEPLRVPPLLLPDGLMLFSLPELDDDSGASWPP